LKCPTENCFEIRPPKARRRFCAGCRAAMRRAAALRPAQVLDRAKRLHKYSDRLVHFKERTEDIKPSTPVRSRSRGRPEYKSNFHHHAQMRSH
jgi:hypothetical protein